MAQQTLSFTGAPQAWVVPAGVTSITFECWGAAGGAADGRSMSSGAGGLGGYAKGVLAVTPGETLNIYVGGAGSTATTVVPPGDGGGWNGGGAAYRGGAADPFLYAHGGGGGGASDVRQGGSALANRKIVAAGGGGGGVLGGGGGGGTTGVTGSGATSGGEGRGGEGGTQAAGGAAGSGGSGTVGTAGVSGVGGAGAQGSAGGYSSGGGGGGGFYGGGGGQSGFAQQSAGGGGGSSYIGAVTDATTTSAVRSGNGLVVLTYNLPPNAPTLVSPVGAVTVDSTSGQRLDWDFSDPDGGDSQSKYDLRYRIVGAPSWTDLTGTTTVTHRDVAAGFFANGNYEWQVRTYDAAGVVGPYSASGFFTVATPPPGPSITDPINGQTISAETYTVVWSSPDQDAYQLRVVADNGAGAPDETTVVYDTGTVVSTSARSALVPFPTNNITRHIQLRVQDAGLWSAPYTTVCVDVSYTTPAAPTLTLFADDSAGSIAVVNANPAPGAGQPAVISHDIYRRETLLGDDGLRVATNVAPAGTWTDWTPASGVDYEYRTVAFGDNGTSSSSAWTGAATEVIPSGTYGGY